MAEMCISLIVEYIHVSSIGDRHKHFHTLNELVYYVFLFFGKLGKINLFEIDLLSMPNV